MILRVSSSFLLFGLCVFPLGAQEPPLSHPGIQHKIDTSYDGSGGGIGGILTKKNCPAEYPNDAYAQCVCECQNKFIDATEKCPTDPCIGAASIARTTCILNCSQYD